MTRTADPATLRSPFALMFPDAVEEILFRAEHMKLPGKKYSPLSKPVPWGRARREFAAFDASIDAEEIDGLDDVDTAASAGRPGLVDAEDDDLDA